MNQARKEEGEGREGGLAEKQNLHQGVKKKPAGCDFFPGTVALYAQTLIVVVLIVVNFFVFLVIAPYPTMRF